MPLRFDLLASRRFQTSIFAILLAWVVLSITNLGTISNDGDE